jgi:hypothetical protein
MHVNLEEFSIQTGSDQSSWLIVFCSISVQGGCGNAGCPPGVHSWVSQSRWPERDQPPAHFRPHERRRPPSPRVYSILTGKTLVDRIRQKNPFFRRSDPLRH